MSYNLTDIRYFTQGDPYHYTVDNRPLSDLESRDNQLLARTQVVDVTGSATPTSIQMPAGWTCTSSGTGVYTITHTLGNNTFVAVGSIVDAAGGVCFVTSFDSSSINIKTTNLAGSATHLRFQLIVSRY
jgi:hypothetical protein